MLPAGQGGHGVAVHRGGNVAAHAVVPGAVVRVEFGGVGDGVAAGVQVAGHAWKASKLRPGRSVMGPLR